jgi:hypothetical protein
VAEGFYLVNFSIHFVVCYVVSSLEREDRSRENEKIERDVYIYTTVTNL